MIQKTTFLGDKNDSIFAYFSFIWVSLEIYVLVKSTDKIGSHHHIRKFMKYEPSSRLLLTDTAHTQVRYMSIIYILAKGKSDIFQNIKDLFFISFHGNAYSFKRKYHSSFKMSKNISLTNHSLN